MVDNYFRKKSLTYANTMAKLDVNKRNFFNIYASSGSHLCQGFGGHGSEDG